LLHLRRHKLGAGFVLLLAAVVVPMGGHGERGVRSRGIGLFHLERTLADLFLQLIRRIGLGQMEKAVDLPTCFRVQVLDAPGAAVSMTGIATVFQEHLAAALELWIRRLGGAPPPPPPTPRAP